MNIQLTKALFAAPLLALALNGCNDSTTGTSSGTGTLNLAVTDAPIDDALQVWVEFTGIELKPSGGTSVDIDFATAKRINLLSLQGTDFDSLLSGQSVSSGSYSWMRLKVNAEQSTQDSYVVTSTGAHSLYIPSGSETGLKLHNPFTILGGTTHDLTIDFDLRKSVHQPQGVVSDYVLKPSLRLLQDTLAGHISGTVPTTQASDTDCAGAVYAFEGSDVTPTDEGPTTPNPVSTALVKLNTESGDYEYEIGFLERGNYTIAFTCEADQDEPTTDDTIAFLDNANAAVTAGQTTTHNFPTP
ncbi:DUF4382 domain-containing protein [Pseudomonadota bacterium]